MSWWKKFWEIETVECEVCDFVLRKNHRSRFLVMAPNPLADLGAGLSTKSVDGNPLPKQHGPIGQTERAFTAASTFLSGLMAISATQFLGAPLKMIDPKFYEAYMAFTKQSFGVLITTMTQWWAPTVVRVSGDKTIPKQLFHKPDGSLECRFPKRLVMMANHQVCNSHTSKFFKI